MLLIMVSVLGTQNLVRRYREIQQTLRPGCNTQHRESMRGSGVGERGAGIVFMR